MIASRSISMAASTACSASSDHGGRRSRNASSGADGAIEDSSSELDIVPRRPLPGRIAKESCRMIRHDQRYAVIVMNLSAQLADGVFGVEQCLCGEGPKGNDHSRLDQLD